MGLRLISKAVMMAMRSRIRFIIFCSMYTTLFALMAWNLDVFMNETNPSSRNIYLLVGALAATIILSILYALIIVNGRKQEIATLKCIGYTNGNIITFVIGELLWVTLFSFGVVVELLLHITAIRTYVSHITQGTEQITTAAPLLSIYPILITFGIFVVFQILGFLAIYRRILNLRPIVALRIMK